MIVNDGSAGKWSKQSWLILRNHPKIWMDEIHHFMWKALKTYMQIVWSKMCKVGGCLHRETGVSKLWQHMHMTQKNKSQNLLYAPCNRWGQCEPCAVRSYSICYTGYPQEHWCNVTCLSVVISCQMVWSYWSFIFTIHLSNLFKSKMISFL